MHAQSAISILRDGVRTSGWSGASRVVVGASPDAETYHRALGAARDRRHDAGRARRWRGRARRRTLAPVNGTEITTGGAKP
jgi:hypothetical protein